MRKQPLITDEYYHIYNRGVDKRDIFNDRQDLLRFIESVMEFNKIETIGSLANFRKTETDAKHLSEPLVAVVAYCFNPNHFHFILKQKVDKGISEFMKRLQGGYTNYFNARNSRSGSLFQGTFKSNLIKEENYFNKMLGYVNKNYGVHTIPKNKMNLVFASDVEYENNKFVIVEKEEAGKVAEIFSGQGGFKKYCNEIVSIIRQERGKPTLLEKDDLPDRC